jgi:zinc finger protein 830
MIQVRKVEYRDKLDDEWDAFQKSIKAETQVSEALVEADDANIQDDRQITEWTEQRDFLQRVEDLLSKQDTLKDEKEKAIKSRMAKMVSNENDSESEEDIDFDEFLDWRVKHV